MKKQYLLFIIFTVINSTSCHAQETGNNQITESDFAKITIVDKIIIGELKATDDSWKLLKDRLGPPVNEELKDEFVNQSRIVDYRGARFYYSDYGAPGKFTLTNISLTTPDFYITINGKKLRVGDLLEDVSYFEHSINEADSTISLKVFVTDSSGSIRRNSSGDKIRSENAYLSMKFDPSAKKIIEINFMWRIV